MSGNDLQAFVDKWTRSGASERANKDAFLIELCDALGVPRPDPTSGDAEKDVYVFEKDAPVLHEGGATSVTKIDLYRKHHFILEAKQGSEAGAKKLGTAKRNTPGWNQAMNDAFGQALGYARSFDEPVPFIVVCDIGHCFELYSDFGSTWQYRPFPNAQQKRLYLKDLPKNPALVERLKQLFTDPHALDPAKHAAKITREVAGHLAELAKRLEKSGHNQISVAKFLMRCLFTMFAEDVGLLPDKLFTEYLKNFWVKSPASFPGGIESLWRTMNHGGHLPTAKILKFNGGLFEASEALALDTEDIKLLLKASECDWSDVEPAIFGTLLERALDPEERHRLGAHYTPRAYVERLVRPTIEEPLREEWDQVRVEVRQLIVELNDIEVRAYANKKQESSLRGAATKKRDTAAKLLRDFHQRLLNLRILDPACGTGNFLYVAMDTLKRLESEVLAELDQLEGGQDLLHVMGARISPEQFLGIEIKPWAKEIAELVLWIGYLQWHFKQYGKTVQVPEPVLRDYKNIECRDAVLAYDREEIVCDEQGRPVTRWDGKTMKSNAATGKEVPDESATALLYQYVNPRKAKWPKADFIIGNPPFVGSKRMRQSLGDGYVETLRDAYPEIPDGTDFVLYWWVKASQLLRSKDILRFGLITTNSITQSLNRKATEPALFAHEDIALLWAIADHPWVDSSDGAAVRIAMTVGGIAAKPARSIQVTKEAEDEHGRIEVELKTEWVDRIHSDLRGGADVAGALPLKANSSLCSVALVRFGDGFLLSSEQAAELEPNVVHPLLTGRDLNQVAEARFVIDFFPHAEREARLAAPKAFQHVLEHVKPGRDQIRDAGSRKRWWRFGRDKPDLRSAISQLGRYIATSEVSKNRVFSFVEAKVRPDHSLVVVASEDAFHLGILQSRVHRIWASAAGGRMGKGNDLRYNRSKCFDPFPFPQTQATELEAIRKHAQDIDDHVKSRRSTHPNLALTSVYNVLEKLRHNAPLTASEKKINLQALVGSLLQLHNNLDAKVFDAYGWPHGLSDEQILERLVALNHERAEEEKRGLIRWLRPEFQNPGGEKKQQGFAGMEDEDEAGEAQPSTAATTGSSPWPKKLAEQMRAVRDLVAPGTSWSASAVAGAFKSAKAEDVHEIMESLASLGMLITVADGSWTAPKVSV